MKKHRVIGKRISAMLIKYAYPSINVYVFIQQIGIRKVSGTADITKIIFRIDDIVFCIKITVICITVINTQIYI